MIPLEEDGFISKRTETGHSYGSLEPYIDTWNAGDMAEVSSNPRTGRPHQAGPSALAQRMHDVGAAAEYLSRTVHAADETAKVLQLLTFNSVKHIPLPSPRDSG